MAVLNSQDNGKPIPSATDNHYAVSAQNAVSRINNAGMILAAYSTIKSRYLEYFGIAMANKKEQQ